MEFHEIALRHHENSFYAGLLEKVMGSLHVPPASHMAYPLTRRLALALPKRVD
ncbi:MAG: hypothetical protein JSV68_16855 [Anaerolineaceae bacterium]|nr:MAG: hypothetical protein JSV68_16855 [Anaerolineaceae bacterium]